MHNYNSKWRRLRYMYNRLWLTKKSVGTSVIGLFVINTSAIRWFSTAPLTLRTYGTSLFFIGKELSQYNFRIFGKVYYTRVETACY